MLELNITAQAHGKAASNIIGLKEEITYALENIADILFIDVKAAEPLQLSFEDKPKIRQKVTVNSAKAELLKHELTIEECQNIAKALVDITKIIEKE